MTRQDLRQLLEKLHSELEHLEVTDEESRQRLRHLDADIRDLLQRSGEDIDTDESMLERLQDSIDHFGTTHPRLALMLSQMMTILSNAGI